MSRRNERVAPGVMFSLGSRRDSFEGFELFLELLVLLVKDLTGSMAERVTLGFFGETSTSIGSLVSSYLIYPIDDVAGFLNHSGLGESSSRGAVSCPWLDSNGKSSTRSILVRKKILC